MTVQIQLVADIRNIAIDRNIRGKGIDAELLKLYAARVGGKGLEVRSVLQIYNDILLCERKMHLMGTAPSKRIPLIIGDIPGKLHGSRGKHRGIVAPGPKIAGNRNLVRLLIHLDPAVGGLHDAIFLLGSLDGIIAADLDIAAVNVKRRIYLVQAAAYI